MAKVQIKSEKLTPFGGIFGSTDFVRGLPTQKLLAKYRRATVLYSK